MEVSPHFLQGVDVYVLCVCVKKDEEQRPFEVDGKEIFSNHSMQAKPKAGEKTDNLSVPAH